MAQSPRTIQAGDIQDERLAGLPLTAAYTYAYLPTVLDDEGRAVDQPAVLNGLLWPLRVEEHPATVMSADLSALAGGGLICRYTVEDHDYLHDLAWRRRQRPARPERSALPRCPVHDSGLREMVGDTLSSVSDQVGSILGGAAANVGGAAANAGQSRVRDAFARIVEDVTFPVDPDKAASYGQRVRDFLTGGESATGGGGEHHDPSGRSERFPAAGTVPVETPPDGAAERSGADGPSAGQRRPAGDAAPPAGEDIWRDVTDDPIDGPTDDPSGGPTDDPSGGPTDDPSDGPTPGTP